MLIQFISYGNINIIKIDAEPKKKKRILDSYRGNQGCFEDTSEAGVQGSILSHLLLSGLEP